MNWDIEKCIIFEALVGSQLYGTSTEDSDQDYRGVCIPPWDVLNDPFQNFEQKDGWDGQYEDRVIYSLKKFFKLCADCNPSIVELLFVPESFWVKPKGIIRKTHPWMQVLEKRDSFISKKAKYTFTGYAHSQLQRIKSHRNWLLHPVKEEPTREHFGLPKNPTLSKEQLNSILVLPSELAKDLWEYADQERHYRDAHNTWSQYDNWKRNRNKDRAVLEERFGYDTKHASHLFRLIGEGRELLTTGVITFPRPDAEELREVREGKYTYDELMEKVGDFDIEFERLYDESLLPHSPDLKKISELYLEIVWRLT